MKRSPREQENKMIDDIILNFDFEKCRKAMIALNWTWLYDEHSPTIENMKECARELLTDAMEAVKKKERPPNKMYSVSTGGFKAIAWANRYGHVSNIKLEFIVDSWDSDGDD